MAPSRLEVHATLGRISIAFAALEHEVREIVIKAAFRGEWVIASALIEDNTLAKNLGALTALARKQPEHIEARICRFTKSTTPLRQRRNLFIHGKWRLSRDDLERGVVSVSDLRVRFEEKENGGKQWSRGRTLELTFAELREIEVDVMTALKEANEILEEIEVDEDA